MPFVKLDTGIVDSSLWSETAQTCKCWITMLAMANPEGFVNATAPGIARRSNLGLSDVEKALELFTAPDTNSRSLDDEGRRVVRVDGGYVIVNYTKYRERDYTNAERQKRWREKRQSNADNALRNGDVTPRNASRSRVQSTEADKEKKPRTMARPQATDEDWLKELEADQTYAGVNIRLEFGKAQNWCKVRGYVLSRKRFINWINNCKPMQANGATPEPKMSAFEITKRIEAIEERLGKTVFDKEKHKDEREALFKRRKELKALLRT